MEDYDELYEFLVGRYPPGISKNGKRAFRRKCKNFTVKDGYLYHCKAVSNVRKQVPRKREEISRILESCHASMEGRSIIKLVCCVTVVSAECSLYTCSYIVTGSFLPT